jgi:hypothetical protein
MLSNKFLLKMIECKSRRDGHIVREPLYLPCGYSVCKECYKQIKFCVECEVNHELSVEKIKMNREAQNIIETNIDELIYKIKEKIEKQKYSTNSNYNIDLSIQVIS